MPLRKGTSRRVISENIRELVSTKPDTSRAKGIRTIAKTRGISYQKAKELQAKAIAMSHAKKSRGSRPPHASYEE